VSFPSAQCRTDKALAIDSEVGGVETGSDGPDNKIATFHIASGTVIRNFKKRHLRPRAGLKIKTTPAQESSFGHGAAKSMIKQAAYAPPSSLRHADEPRA
jgi:hypothetical protein